MEGRYGWTSLRNEEFQEEDVWAVLKEATYFSSSKVDSPDSTSPNSRQQLPGTFSIMIPRVDNNSGQEREMYPKSAPVKIPDWSSIYGNNSKTASWLDLDDNGGGGGGGSGGDGEDEDDDGKTMPPHEWMAKKLARSNTFAFSVCEGAGRTLKGRDLSRVRNTVLTKTGFLE